MEDSEVITYVTKGLILLGLVSGFALLGFAVGGTKNDTRMATLWGLFIIGILVGILMLSCFHGRLR